LKNGGGKREGRAQKEKRGAPASEASNMIETHQQAGEFKEW
jgi:hypothetical protein